MQFVADAYAAAHEAGIRPFLTYGTLLGCVREGRILPQDNDIDIGILHTDYAKKYAFFAAMRRRGYLVEHDIAYTYRFVRPDYDLYMDVDVLYPWRDKMVCSRFVDGQYQEAAIFPAHAFDELKPARLGDLPVLVPAQAELVLDSIYRDWRVDLKAKDPSCYVNILPALMVDPDLAVPAFALMDEIGRA